MKRFSNLLAESLRFPPVTAVRQKSYTPSSNAASNEYFLTLDFRERIRGPIPSNAT